jgi:ABC-type metal ion transport system substrate-binding protein
MPLVSVDRVGGTIVTDWYSTSSNLNERIKFNIFVLDEKMQNESVNIIMFKETFNGSNWISSVANKKTSIQIKELILKKARQLKAASELS